MKLLHITFRLQVTLYPGKVETSLNSNSVSFVIEKNDIGRIWDSCSMDKACLFQLVGVALDKRLAP
jgi:hypothetical protein